jgi:hypothetical protein
VGRGGMRSREKGLARVVARKEQVSGRCKGNGWGDHIIKGWMMCAFTRWTVKRERFNLNSDAHTSSLCSCACNNVPRRWHC